MSPMGPARPRACFNPLLVEGAGLAHPLHQSLRKKFAMGLIVGLLAGQGVWPGAPPLHAAQEPGPADASRRPEGHRLPDGQGGPVSADGSRDPPSSALQRELATLRDANATLRDHVAALEDERRVWQPIIQRVQDQDATVQYLLDTFETLNHQQATLYDTLGGTYIHAGALDLAIEAYTQALVADPDDQEAQYSLGLLHAQTHHAPEARAHLERYLQLTANRPSLKRREAERLIQILQGS